MKSFPMFIRTTDRRVVIVGGGEQAAQKTRLILKTDARIIQAAPRLENIGKRMQAYGDDVESVRSFGADVVAALCERLVDGGAPGLHFYTLNLAKPTQTVLKRLAM